MNKVLNGVTVIICCYNSVDLLFQTLKHLSLQEVPENFPWEIILVNNASTDQTASFAIETWNILSPESTNFRVIDEPVPGQMYARKRGAIEAKYDCLIFCDDDNWLDTQYIFQSKKTMDINRRIGACGGQNAPVTDAPEYPEWFETYKDKYALGIPAPESGDVSHRGFVLGAGMVTRKSLFLRLMDEQYPSLLPGRTGKKLSTGDDFEYCKRLLLWGYSLQYNADMKLLHFIPKERLTVPYRDRLMEGISDAGKVLAEYDKALEIKKKIQNKSKLRLVLMTPFRILLAQLGLSGRKANDERLKLFYLLPFKSHVNNNRRIIKKLLEERPDMQNSYKIFSFYNSNVNPKIPKYQKAVFTKFGYPIIHVVNEQFTHGDFINHIFRTVTDVDFLIFFDIDCIPVKKKWAAKLLEDLAEPRTIVGAAQTANHLREGKNLYVSPFFFAISTAYIRELGYPDMNMTEDMDTGQNLTGEVLRNGGIVKYWWPTHIEKEEWNLYHPEHSKFGPGTTYNDLIYHAFLSRFDISNRFKNKCKSILYGFLFRVWKALERK